MGNILHDGTMGLSCVAAAASTDEEAVEQIEENPYLQYFLGFPEYQQSRPFDPSMYVHFRKRLGEDVLADYNDLIIKRAIEQITEKDSKEDGEEGLPCRCSLGTGNCRVRRRNFRCRF